MGEKYNLKSIVCLVPNFLKLYYRLMKDKRVPLKKKLYLPAVIAYILNPLDLIPDFIPLIGKLDDTLLCFMTVRCLLTQVDKKVMLSHWDGNPEIIDDIEGLIKLAESLIPSRYTGVVKKLDKLVGC